MTIYYSDEDEPEGSDSEDDSIKGNPWLHTQVCYSLVFVDMYLFIYFLFTYNILDSSITSTI